MIYMDETSLNTLLERCRNTVDEIATIYRYPSNITHLLYLIVPAFIIKYGYDQERYLFKAFTEIPVLILDSGDKVYQAYYSSIPEKGENGYVTRKGIVLKHYQDIDLMQLLDNLTHEFNHAVNSIHNEVLEKEDRLYIRTGLTYVIYDKNTLKPISKEDNSIVEEIINTKQTEMLIDIINSFNQYTIHDREISNTLYSIGNSITNKRYRSGAYLLQSLLCQELMNNKTFIATLENLRFHGHVEDIQGWFDQITGVEGSFSKLVQLLSETLTLQLDISKKKGIKFLKVNKVKKMTGEALEIVRLFDQNCNYR